jgi:hypothetical protein
MLLLHQLTVKKWGDVGETLQSQTGSISPGHYPALGPAGPVAAAVTVTAVTVTEVTVTASVAAAVAAAVAAVVTLHLVC